MTSAFPIRAFAFFLAAAVASASGASAPVEKSRPADRKAPTAASQTGPVENFGQVTERLWRGAQPNAEAIAFLARQGVKTIVNIRTNSSAHAAEERSARENGIQYIRIPLQSGRAPSEDQLRRILDAIETAPGLVFLHCENGANRTGLVVACLRIEKQQWTAERALAEADRFAMREAYTEMREFVRRFAERRPAGAAPKTAPGS